MSAAHGRHGSPTTPGAAPEAVAFRVLAVVPSLGERLETLQRTLASIHGQQGVAVDTVLVVRRATAALDRLAADCGVRLIEDAGHISAAVNAGFALAGDAHRYVFWLGDDDQLRPGALASATAALERDASAVVCFGNCDYVDIGGATLFSRRPPWQAPLLLQFVPGLIKQEACVFRASAVRIVGGLDVALRYTMDLDLLLKLRRTGRFVRVPRVQAAFCWHRGSLTIANRGASLDEAQAVQRRHARGLARLALAVLQLPMRWLVLSVAARVNSKLGAH